MKILIVLLILLAGCVTDAPRMYPTPGAVQVHTTTAFLGLIPVKTVVKSVESAEATAARLAREKAERLQAIELDQKGVDLKRRQRQESAAFWFGCAMLALAAGCVAFGAITHGWKFWGGMAATFGCMGAFAWGFAAWLPYLKWGCIPVVIAAVFRVMHSMREVDVVKSVKGRLAEKRATKEKEKENTR